MPFNVVHGGQVSLLDLEKALVAVSQSTGIIVIADPDQECIHSVPIAEVLKAAPNAPNLKMAQVPTKDICGVKVSLDGLIVAVYGSRSISFLSVNPNASLSPLNSSTATFSSELVDFDWSVSIPSRYAVVTSDGHLHIGDLNLNKRAEWPLNVTSCCWTLKSSAWLACGHRNGAVSIVSSSTGKAIQAWPDVFPSSVVFSSAVDKSVLLFAAHPPDGDIVVKILNLRDPLSVSNFKSIDDWFTGSPEPGCRILFARIPHWNIVMLSTSTLTETTAFHLSSDAGNGLSLKEATDVEGNPLLFESVTNCVASPANSLAIDYYNAKSAGDRFGSAAPIVLLFSSEGKLDFFNVINTENPSLDVDDYVCGRALVQALPGEKENSIIGLSKGVSEAISTPIKLSAELPKSSINGFQTRLVSPSSAHFHSTFPSSSGKSGSVSYLADQADPGFHHTNVDYKDFVPQSDLERAFLKGMRIIDDALRSSVNFRVVSKDIDINTLVNETESAQSRLCGILGLLPSSSVTEIENDLHEAHSIFQLARAELNAHERYIEELRRRPLDDSSIDIREKLREYIAMIGDNIELLRIEIDRRRLNRSQRPLQLLYCTINQNAETIARLRGELDGLVSSFDEMVAIHRTFRPKLLTAPKEVADSSLKLDQFLSRLQDDLSRLRKKVPPTVTTEEDDLWEMSLDLDEVDKESKALMEELERKPSDTQPIFSFPDDDLSAIESIFSSGSFDSGHAVSDASSNADALPLDSSTQEGEGFPTAATSSPKLSGSVSSFPASTNAFSIRGPSDGSLAESTPAFPSPKRSVNESSFLSSQSPFAIREQPSTSNISGSSRPSLSSASSLFPSQSKSTNAFGFQASTAPNAFSGFAFGSKPSEASKDSGFASSSAFHSEALDACQSFDASAPSAGLFMSKGQAVANSTASEPAESVPIVECQNSEPAGVASEEPVRRSPSRESAGSESITSTIDDSEPADSVSNDFKSADTPLPSSTALSASYSDISGASSESPLQSPLFSNSSKATESLVNNRQVSEPSEPASMSEIQEPNSVDSVPAELTSALPSQPDGVESTLPDNEESAQPSEGGICATATAIAEVLPSAGLDHVTSDQHAPASSPSRLFENGPAFFPTSQNAFSIRGQPSTGNLFGSSQAAPSLFSSFSSQSESAKISGSQDSMSIGASDGLAFGSKPFEANNDSLMSSSDIQGQASEGRPSLDLSATLGSNWFDQSKPANSAPATNPFGIVASQVAISSGPLPKVENPFTKQSTGQSFKSVFGQTSASPAVSNPFASGSTSSPNLFAVSSASNAFGSSSTPPSNPFASSVTSSSNNPFKPAPASLPVFGQASALGSSSFGSTFGSASTGLTGFGGASLGSPSKPFGSNFASASNTSGSQPISNPFGSSSNSMSFSSFGQANNQNNSNPSSSFGQTQFTFDTSSFRGRRGDDD